MFQRCVLVPALLLSVVPAVGCGGGLSGTPIGKMVAVQAAALPAAEGWILDGAVPFPGGPQLSIGDTPSDVELVGILGFDLSALVNCQSATFTIHRASLANDPWALGPLRIDHIDGGGIFDIGDASTVALTESAHLLDVDQDSWALDVTALVAADLAAGRTTTSLRFRFDTPTNFDGTHDQLYLATSQHGDSLLRPVLIVSQLLP